MFFIIESKKSFEEASKSLENAIQQVGFGILSTHDLDKQFAKKGIKCSDQCRVFEICDVKPATDVLAIDIKLNMALPCRISLYTENGEVKLGMIKPAAMLMAMSSDAVLKEIAIKVESRMMEIIKLAQ